MADEIKVEEDSGWKDELEACEMKGVGLSLHKVADGQKDSDPEMEEVTSQVGKNENVEEEDMVVSCLTFLYLMCFLSEISDVLIIHTYCDCYSRSCIVFLTRRCQL